MFLIMSVPSAPQNDPQNDPDKNVVVTDLLGLGKFGTSLIDAFSKGISGLRTDKFPVGLTASVFLLLFLLVFVAFISSFNIAVLKDLNFKLIIYALLICTGLIGTSFGVIEVIKYGRTSLKSPNKRKKTKK